MLNYPAIFQAVERLTREGYVRDQQFAQSRAYRPTHRLGKRTEPGDQLALVENNGQVVRLTWSNQGWR